MRVYVESEPTFRRLLMTVADRLSPEGRMTFEDLSKAVGWPRPRSLPGARGAYVRRARRRYDRYWPFHRKNSRAGRVVWMDHRVAGILRDLHAERALPLHR